MAVALLYYGPLAVGQLATGGRIGPDGSRRAAVVRDFVVQLISASGDRAELLWATGNWSMRLSCFGPPASRATE